MAEVLELVDACRTNLFEGAVCTLGVFDGVHRGHRLLIDESANRANSIGAPAVIITFSPDPDEVFRGAAFKKIMSDGQRVKALVSCGADSVVVVPFDKECAQKSPEKFLDVLFKTARPKALHVGDNFRFGCGAQGDTSFLLRWCEERAIECAVVGLLKIDGIDVSSTRIRTLLEQGDVSCARELLGHPYRFVGTVLHGREAGREMGIRTANLEVPESLRVLRDGVYGARARIDGTEYGAAVSVGVSPTFSGEATANMEVHLIDFEGDIYGLDLSVEFLCRLRDMQTFDDTSALVQAIEGDIAWVRENVIVN